MVDYLLVTNDYPPKTGGIQVYLHELWRRLPEGRSAVLTASSDPTWESFDATSGVPTTRVPAGTLFMPTPGALSAVKDAIARYQPTLVLIDPAWPLGLLGPHLPVPYGVILHGAEVTIPGRLPLASQTLRRVLAGASVAICAGGYPAAEAQRNATDKMPGHIMVPPGVDVERFVPLSATQRAAARERFGWAPDDFVVVSYSRLVPRKGMDVLIRASVDAMKDIANLKVVIGGSGRDRERLEKLSTSLSAPVNFWGRISDEDLPELIGAADVMVMDCRSRWAGFEQEGFGIVFLEAAACGIPQIAGRSGGSHEAVIYGETGIVLDNPRSSDDLARALVRLAADPLERARLGARAREVATERFSWDHLASHLDESLAPYLT